MTNQELMKRYLLGEASVEERIDLENRYLSDASVFEELAETENDLIDSYVRGKLSDTDRLAFDKFFLNSPQRRARLAFATALTEISRESKQVDSVEKPSFRERMMLLFDQLRPRPQWALVTAVIAIALVFGWLKVTNDQMPQVSSRPQRQSAGSQSMDNAAQPVGNSGAEIAKLNNPTPGEYTVQLSPGIVRSGGSEVKAFAVPTATKWINLQLSLDTDVYSSYTAIVETADGHQVKRSSGLKGQRQGGSTVVVLRLSSGLIPPDDYVIRLRGKGGSKDLEEEEVETYSFRALRR